ncbi:hypothetical protein D1872_259380 [compost metagenome]
MASTSETSGKRRCTASISHRGRRTAIPATMYPIQASCRAARIIGTGGCLIPMDTIKSTAIIFVCSLETFCCIRQPPNERYRLSNSPVAGDRGGSSSIPRLECLLYIEPRQTTGSPRRRIYILSTPKREQGQSRRRPGQNLS